MKSLFRRRPSAPMLVSLLALFVALGGTATAAFHLPRGSVGRAQLRNGSVTQAKIQNGAVWNWKLAFNSVGSRKIQNGAVGAQQVNSRRVQLRVASACTSGAIKSIGQSGTVACSPTLPTQYGTSASAKTLGTSATQIASKGLPGSSSYLVLAFPHAVVTPAVAASGQQVEVDCTLAVSPSNGATKTSSAIVEIGGQHHPQADTIPLAVPAVAAASGATATVSCTHSYSPGTPAPTVAVDTTLNAIQTATNG